MESADPREDQRTGFISGLNVHVDVQCMRLAVELAVPAFRHGGCRRRQLAVHSLGKALPDGFQFCRDQYAKAVFRQKGQLLLFGNDVQDVSRRVGQLFFEQQRLLASLR